MKVSQVVAELKSSNFSDEVTTSVLEYLRENNVPSWTGSPGAESTAKGYTLALDYIRNSKRVKSIQQLLGGFFGEPQAGDDVEYPTSIEKYNQFLIEHVPLPYWHRFHFSENKMLVSLNGIDYIEIMLSINETSGNQKTMFTPYELYIFTESLDDITNTYLGAPVEDLKIEDDGLWFRMDRDFPEEEWRTYLSDEDWRKTFGQFIFPMEHEEYDFYAPFDNIHMIMNILNDSFPINYPKSLQSILKLIVFLKKFGVGITYQRGSDNPIVDSFFRIEPLDYDEVKLVIKKTENGEYELTQDLTKTYNILWHWYNDPLYRTEASIYLNSLLPRDISGLLLQYVNA